MCVCVCVCVCVCIIMKEKKNSLQCFFNLKTSFKALKRAYFLCNLVRLKISGT